MSTFDRSISPEFELALTAEVKLGGWWRDVLDDSSLVVALRGTYLNVYFQGQSIFKVMHGRNGLRVTTHKKYLVDPSLAGQAHLNGADFRVADFEKSVLIRTYAGPETLKKMKAAARLYSGAEKRGVHKITANNPTVIDLEVAFSGAYSLKGSIYTRKTPRIDLAAIEPSEDGVRLVFWEAKHYSNPDLRAYAEADISVLDQVALYRQCLREKRDEVERSYRMLAGNLASLRKHSGALSPINDVLEDIRIGKKKLTLGAEPKVGLLVYGFDDAQRRHSDWQKHAERLTRLLPATEFIAIGDPDGFVLPGCDGKSWPLP